MIDSVLADRNAVLIISTVLFFISFFLLSVTKIPNRKSVMKLKEYIPKIKISITTYKIFYILICAICSISIVKFLSSINRNPASVEETNIIAFYFILAFSIVALFIALAINTIQKIGKKNNDDVLYIVNNMPAALFKLVYPTFKKNYYVTNDTTISQRRKKEEDRNMNIHIDEVYTNIMKKEMIYQTSKILYILLIIILIILLLLILISIINSKKISKFIYVFIVAISLILLLIVINHYKINKLFIENRQSLNVDICIDLESDCIVIKNITNGTTRTINGESIKRIAYDVHTTILYLDTTTTFIPYCGNIDYLIKNK